MIQSTVGFTSPQTPAAAPTYTSTVKHLVKAGVALTKGQAVYVTGSTGNAGTNMIVGKASNASEPTSSKTMGLIESSLAVNGQGYVITEGLLAGLNTNGATAGDPVWLGVDGELIFGLLNKPAAPQHLVFIGIVTRAQQNNGEIFVKVQNGFEVEELHNVVLTNKQDGDTIVWDTTTGKWINAAIVGETGPQGIQGETGPTGATGAAGPGVATGGTAGQYLTKVNGADYNTQWSTLDLSGYQSKVTNVSDTEIGYLDGVTSALQTQLNNKINTTGTNTISLTTTNESDPLTIQSKNGHGGEGFAGILTVENTTTGTTNPKKFIRINSTGGLEVVNNGYTATIFSISDLGDLGGVRNATFSGAISATNFNNDAWNSYVPSLSTESGTWTIGNGSIDGAWRLINRTCHFRLKITFGSTTSAGPGTLNISLPTQAASSTYQFPVSLLDNGNAWYEATANGDYLGNRLKFAMICNSGGSSKSSEGVTATSPFTFGAGDAISISGTYEIG